MLRIDETSKTLVAPEQAAPVAEPALDRDELRALLASGWKAFAAEIGEPGLSRLATAPADGVDLLAFDQATGRIAVVAIGRPLAETLSGAATVSGWDADELAAIHPMLAAAVPGESPRIVVVDAETDERELATLDWLVRRHGLDAVAYEVRTLRFGAERLVDVARVYPAAGPGAASAAAEFFAAVTPAGATATAPGHSAPPPGVRA